MKHRKRHTLITSLALDQSDFSPRRSFICVNTTKPISFCFTFSCVDSKCFSRSRCLRLLRIHHSFSTTTTTSSAARETKSVESSSSLLDMALRPESNLLALLGGCRYRGAHSLGGVYLEKRARSNSVSSIPSVSTTLSDDSFDGVSMVSSASSRRSLGRSFTFRPARVMHSSFCDDTDITCH